MQNFPHHYVVTADGGATGRVIVSSPNIPDLTTDAPAEFDGPGDVWSPETMLVGAVANCFILTFRAVARASKFEWTSITCHVQGVLDRVERVTQFTVMELQVKLRVPTGADVERARRLLEKSEQNCLITSSLKATVALQAEVEAG